MNKDSCMAGEWSGRVSGGGMERRVRKEGKQEQTMYEDAMMKATVLHTHF